MGNPDANIFDRLTQMDKNFQVQPMLAESWEFKEPNIWRFNLRKDVKFHNGEPFTSKAVVENLKRIATGGFAANLRIDVNSPKAVDDYTVEVTTTGKVLMPAQLVHPIFSIPAPGTDLLKQRIGTGPFKEVEYIKDKHMIVEKNPDYWGDKAKLDRIEFRFYPDPNSRVLALQAGEADLIYEVPRESATVLKGQAGYTVINAPVTAYQALSVMINGSAPYETMKDIKLREAVGYAIDRQAISESAWEGFASSSQTFIPAAVLGKYADKVKGYTFDPDRAKSLLDEAGWKDADGDGIREKNGKPLKLELINGFPSATANSTTPELLQAQLKAVGIDLVINKLADDASYDEKLGKKEGDLWLEIGNQNTASPCFLPFLLYYGKAEKPNEYQLAFAPGGATDDAIDACTNTANLDEAAMHAADAMHGLIDEARAIIPMIGVSRLWATTNKVTGFDPNPVLIHVRWGNVDIAK
jgi:peptide/nickel transport system substrate-binding protein